MIRSPSFSRSASSTTMINSPLAIAEIASSIELRTASVLLMPSEGSEVELVLSFITAKFR